MHPRAPDHRTRPIDKSGFPFQLAVERELRSLGRKHAWEVVATEVPLGDSFADIVLRRENVLAVIECKRVEDDVWQFLVPKGSSSNINRCRVEWHNPNVSTSSLITSVSYSRIFCAECTMCEGSYEPAISILPKKGATNSLESISREVLLLSHTLGDLYKLEYGDPPTYVVPVVVTNAELQVCEYDPATLDLQHGRLGVAEFAQADFLRFRKTLVARHSNDYYANTMTLENWTADRERTVFVVSPSGLGRFLSGFRAFKYDGTSEHPPEFDDPPRPLGAPWVTAG